MFDSNAIHCTAVFNTYDRTATEMPPALTAARADIAAGRAATLDVYGTTSASLVEAAVDAITEGRDPHEDPTLQRLAVDFALGQCSYGVLEALRNGPARAAVALLRQQSDAILETWREPFETAAANLTDTDPEVASDAARTVDQILAGWSALHHLTRGAFGSEHTALRYATVDYDTVIAGIQHHADVTPTGLAKTGHDIALSGFVEFAKRVDTFEAERARRAEVRVAQSMSDAPVDPLGWVRA